MISIIDSGKLVNTEVSPMVPRSCEMVGLSTDTKPTGVSVGNGWSFIEMDTGKVFFYNAADEEWLEFAGSGGGGGQGGSNVLVITFSVSGSTMTSDKTWKQIYDAPYAVGMLIMQENDKAQYDIPAVFLDNGAYTVQVLQPGVPAEEALILTTDSEDGYPSITMGG